ncbi:MAG: MBG domain-containing protein [Atopobiaceae bacterium]|nr:MBG domain-containing protein [Atopobiaceae bacterium]
MGTTSNISVRASKAGYKTVRKDDLHVSVAQKTVTVTANNDTKKHGEDDPSFSATVSGTLNNDTVSYALSRAEGEKPGSYAITPSGKASQGNYSVTFVPGTLTITAANIDDEARFKVSNPSDVTYNGTSQQQKPAVHDAATFTTTGSQTVAGKSDNTYTLTFDQTAEESSYTVSKSVGKLEVTAGDIADADTFTVSQPEDTTYNGESQQQSVTVSFKNGGAVSTDDYTVSYSEDTVNAGTVTVTITGKDNLSGQVTRKYQILPKGYTVTTEGASKTYDGTPLTATGHVDGILPSETYTFEVTGSQTNVGKSTNGYTLTFGGGVFRVVKARSLFAAATTPAKSSNYKLDQENLGVFEVTAAEINPDTPDPNHPDQKRFTITAPSDVTCNGTSQQQKPAVHDATTGKDLVEGTDYTLSYSDDTTNAGKVTVTIAGIGNYAGSTDTAYQIKQAEVVVKAADASKNYGEKDPSFKATVDGLAKGESESLIKYELTREPGETPGTYAVKASGEEPQSNYSVTFVNGTLTITEAPATPEPQKPETPKAEPAKQETAKVPDTSDTNAQAPVGLMAAVSAALMAMGVHLRRKSRDDEE